MKEFLVKQTDQGQTLEKYVRRILESAPTSFIYKLFRKKDVKVNGHWQKNNYVINVGEVIAIYVTDAQYDEFTQVKKINPKDEISSLIIYEDENILLINKPRGLLVQKDSADSKALDDMVIAYLTFKGDFDPNDPSSSAGPIHRLDRNTAGIVVFSKNLITSRYLNSVINDKDKIKKHYLTLVKGNITKNGAIDLPLARNSNDKAFISAEGKNSKTIYSVVKNYNGYTLLDIILLSGRMHQIRVHMSSIGNPIIGDDKYGDFALNKQVEKDFGFKNQFLCANKLILGQLDGHLSYLSNRVFEVELPTECKNLLNKLK